MRISDRRRFGLAILFSLLAHTTALVLLLPIYAAIRAVKVLLADENETLKVALLFAILLHLTILLPLIHWILSAQEDVAERDLVSVDLWSHEQKAKETPDKEKTPEEELEEYEPEEEIPKGQVVKAPPSKDRQKPKKSRFVSEQDARVEKETQSRIKMPGVSQIASTPSLEGKGADSETKPGGMRAEQYGVAPMPSQLQQSDHGAVTKERRAPPSLMDINLEPSKHAIASALAGTGLDHLDNVIDGDATALNTMGWRYASFFNRVKSKVERYWHPDREYRKRDPYGNIYGFKDRMTLLLVVLRGDGTLKKAYVMSPSGASFLDDEAREAMEQAAPFPNVPDGLKDKRDGLVKFTFHFIVEVGEQPILRMRRYR